MVSLWEPLRALPPVPEPDSMRAAVLVPIYESEDGLRVIMTRRPDDMPTHPGDVVFPGGMVDPGDEGPVDTAMREACEEIGLPRENVVEVLGGLTPTHTRSQTMVIVPVVARVKRPETLVPEPREVAAILEPAISELLDEATWESREWSPGRHMWFREFSEGTLWGATAFMVRELLDYFR